MTDFCRKRIRERSEPTPSLHVRERPAAAWEGMSKAAFVLSWTRSLRTRTEPRAPCKHRRTWAGQVRVVAGKARPKTRGTPLNVESAGRRHHRSPHRRNRSRHRPPLCSRRRHPELDGRIARLHRPNDSSDLHDRTCRGQDRPCHRRDRFRRGPSRVRHRPVVRATGRIVRATDEFVGTTRPIVGRPGRPVA
jgi:hypothetical protein